MQIWEFLDSLVSALMSCTTPESLAQPLKLPRIWLTLLLCTLELFPGFQDIFCVAVRLRFVRYPSIYTAGRERNRGTVKPNNRDIFFCKLALDIINM